VRPIYDEIGVGYANTRLPDPRISAQIKEAIGRPYSLLNVGAGTGSYEPDDLAVVALEPSSEMIRQRPRGSGPVVQGVAEALPFSDNRFEVVTAFLTLHHWTDRDAGIAEIKRVARNRLVIFTWVPDLVHNSWLVSDYIPENLDLDLPRFPPEREVLDLFPKAEIIPVPIPHDCQDGFMEAYWRRPWAYLAPETARGISTFNQLPKSVLERGLAKLERDLESGEWDRRYGHLLEKPDLDLGYRLLVVDL